VLRAMRRKRRTVTARLALAAVLVAAGAACDHPATEPTPAQPTPDSLAATPNAVGVPYDQYLLIRRGERLIALQLTAVTPLGDRVAYRWYVAGSDRRFARPKSLEMGGGEAVERPYTGRITLPGSLTLDWSRGSREFGWLYWPEGSGDYAVYSRPFTELADADPDRDTGRWLDREMFRR
jgi:hypothetical protein